MRNLIVEIVEWISWTSNWAALAMGLGVTVSVLWFSGAFMARRRPAAPANEDDLPWDQLLQLVKSQGAGGDEANPEYEMPPEDTLQRLLQQIPAKAAADGERTPAQTTIDRREAIYLEFGPQRRASRRRWLNPIEVTFTTAFDMTPIHGMAVNRSAGGIAILTDHEHPLGATLFVKPIAAPKSLAPVAVTVRHATPAGKLWIIGCQYLNDPPWNVKVWFG